MMIHEHFDASNQPMREKRCHFFISGIYPDHFYSYKMPFDTDIIDQYKIGVIIILKGMESITYELLFASEL